MRGQLLASVIPGRLDEQVRDQILAETRGNPLALLELPRGLTPAQLAGGFGLPGALSLSKPDRGALPAAARRPCRMRHSGSGGRRGGADSAIQRSCGARRSAWDHRPGVRAGRIGRADRGRRRVRFRHPLVRSAVYRAATAELERQAHQALADATDAGSIATGARGICRGGARRRTARRRRTRAGRPTGPTRAEASQPPPAFLERAAALTPEPTRRAQRALAAAQAKYEAGAFDDAGALADHGRGWRHRAPERCRALSCARRSRSPSSRGGDAPRSCCTPRESWKRRPGTGAGDVPGSLSAAHVRRSADPRRRHGGGQQGRPCRPATAASAAPVRSTPGRVGDRFTDGYAAGAPILKEAVSAFGHERVLPPEEARWLAFASQIALDLWDEQAWTVLSTRHLELVREIGALTALPFVLTTRISVLTSFGDLGAAASLQEEIARPPSDRDRPPLRRALAGGAARSRGRAHEVDPNHDQSGRGARRRTRVDGRQAAERSAL